jgi:hypothetical protein
VLHILYINYMFIIIYFVLYFNYILIVYLSLYIFYVLHILYINYMFIIIYFMLYFSYILYINCIFIITYTLCVTYDLCIYYWLSILTCWVPAYLFHNAWKGFRSQDGLSYWLNGAILDKQTAFRLVRKVPPSIRPAVPPVLLSPQPASQQ